MFDAELTDKAEALLQTLRDKKHMLASAESCTGGLIAGLLTEIAGSSDVVDRGFVTYSNEAKNECLGVPVALLEEHGAVSEEVARAMAKGAVHRSRASIAVAVTGVAGPGGGTPQKPVGLVHLAVARSGGATLHKRLNLGDIGRGAVRIRRTCRRATGRSAARSSTRGAARRSRASTSRSTRSRRRACPDCDARGRAPMAASRSRASPAPPTSRTWSARGTRAFPTRARA